MTTLASSRAGAAGHLAPICASPHPKSATTQSLGLPCGRHASGHCTGCAHYAYEACKSHLTPACAAAVAAADAKPSSTADASCAGSHALSQDRAASRGCCGHSAAWRRKPSWYWLYRSGCSCMCKQLPRQSTPGHEYTITAATSRRAAEPATFSTILVTNYTWSSKPRANETLNAETLKAPAPASCAAPRRRCWCTAAR